MKDIEGFHILWTAPYFEKSKDDTYSCLLYTSDAADEL